MRGSEDSHSLFPAIIITSELCACTVANCRTFDGVVTLGLLRRPLLPLVVSWTHLRDGIIVEAVLSCIEKRDYLGGQERWWWCSGTKAYRE